MEILRKSVGYVPSAEFAVYSQLSRSDVRATEALSMYIDSLNPLKEDLADLIASFRSDALAFEDQLLSIKRANADVLNGEIVTGFREFKFNNVQSLSKEFADEKDDDAPFLKIMNVHDVAHSGNVASALFSELSEKKLIKGDVTVVPIGKWVPALTIPDKLRAEGGDAVSKWMSDPNNAYTREFEQTHTKYIELRKEEVVAFNKHRQDVHDIITRKNHRTRRAAFREGMEKFREEAKGFTDTIREDELSALNARYTNMHADLVEPEYKDLVARNLKAISEADTAAALAEYDTLIKEAKDTLEALKGLEILPRLVEDVVTSTAEEATAEVAEEVGAVAEVAEEVGAVAEVAEEVGAVAEEA